MATMILSILDEAAKAGTYPMQVLLLGAIIAEAIVISYLHKDNKKTFKEFQESSRIKDEAVNRERLDRISMLIDVIKEDTRAKQDLKNAIDNNTRTIERFEELLTKFTSKR